jgi:ribosome-associated protein
MPASKSAIDHTQIAAQAAADKFGTEIVALDLSEQAVLSEVFLIVTAQNVRQVAAISDWVEEKLRLAGDKPVRREISEEWALLDYSDLVVHIQSKTLRSYYMLDRLWNDCPTIALNIVEPSEDEEVVNG